jgi:hypothetical protein
MSGKIKTSLYVNREDFLRLKRLQQEIGATASELIRRAIAKELPILEKRNKENAGNGTL